jgi:hypothetical protein
MNRSEEKEGNSQPLFSGWKMLLKSYLTPPQKETVSGAF